MMPGDVHFEMDEPESPQPLAWRRPVHQQLVENLLGRIQSFSSFHHFSLNGWEQNNSRVTVGQNGLCRPSAAGRK